MNPTALQTSKLIRNIAKTVYRTGIRPIATSNHLFSEDSFTIQDPKDFDDRVKNSKVPVIVDFYANWCAPCRTLGPRIETIIAENEGKVKLAKVDIDANTDLAMNYEIGSIPVLIAVRNGKVEERLEGLQDADKLKKWVAKFIEHNEKK